MSTATVPIVSNSLKADTAASANTLPYRDNQGGITHNAVNCTSLVNSGASFRAFNVTAKTATYTVLAPTAGVGGDSVVFYNPSGGAFAINLPLASTCSGMVVTFKNVTNSTTACTLTCAGSDTLDGAATLALTTAWQKITIQSNGTVWYIIGA